MNDELICGIDEAGRGSLVGPLVIAGFAVPVSIAEDLPRIGVDDSKRLTRKRRLEVYQRLMDTPCVVEVAILDPVLVDSSTKARGGKGINKLEIVFIGEIAKRIGARKLFIDSLYRDAERFSLLLRSGLGDDYEILSEIRADLKYPIVGAASIVAKVERDLWIEELRERFGDVGSGYPSDEKTRRFVRSWIASRRSVPGFVRASWRTTERLYPKLDDYE